MKQKVNFPLALTLIILCGVLLVLLVWKYDLETKISPFISQKSFSVENKEATLKLWMPGIEPDGIPSNIPIKVMFTVLVTGAKYLESLRLVESDLDGNILREIGELRDDGNDFDLVAGDLIYSNSFEIVSAKEGKQYYIAQTKIDAYPIVYVSEPAILTITSFPIGPAPSDENLLVTDLETGQELYSNELIVSFNEGVSEERIREIIEVENASVVGTILSLGVYQLQIEGDGTARGVNVVAEALETYEEVKYAEPNYAVNIFGLMKEEASIFFDGEIINQGDEFTIVPSEHCIGSIKLKLIEALPDYVIIDILEDKSFDGKFYPRDKVERKEIKTDTCIYALPLCTDVWFKYCFEISKSDSQIILEYKIEGGSTMPLP